MKRVVSAVEARQKLGELLDGAYYRGDEIVIERAGKVMGVIVPPGRYEAIERARDRVVETIANVHERTRDIPSDVLDKAVADAIAEVRGGGPRRARKHA